MTVEKVIQEAKALLDARRDDLGDSYEVALKAIDKVAALLDEGVVDRKLLAGVNLGLALAIQVINIAMTVADTGDERAMAASIGSTVSLYGIAVAAIIEAQKGRVEA